MGPGAGKKGSLRQGVNQSEEKLAFAWPGMLGDRLVLRLSLVFTTLLGLVLYCKKPGEPGVAVVAKPSGPFADLAGDYRHEKRCTYGAQLFLRIQADGNYEADGLGCHGQNRIKGLVKRVGNEIRFDLPKDFYSYEENFIRFKAISPGRVAPIKLGREFHGCFGCNEKINIPYVNVELIISALTAKDNYLSSVEKVLELVSIYEFQGMREKVIEVFSKALDKYKNNVKLLASRAGYWKKQQEFENALADFQTMARLPPLSEEQMRETQRSFPISECCYGDQCDGNIMEMLNALGKYEPSRKVYKSRARDPLGWWHQYLYAQALVGLGDVPLACFTIRSLHEMAAQQSHGGPETVRAFLHKYCK